MRPRGHTRQPSLCVCPSQNDTGQAVAIILAQRLEAKSYPRHYRPMGRDIIVETVADMKRRLLVVIVFKFIYYSDSLVEVVLPSLRLGGDGSGDNGKQ